MSCRIKRVQDLIKSAMSGRPNELLRKRRLAPRPRGGWAEHPVQCRLASFTDHRTASPLRLRLAVVYAEQPPAASSTNADDACSARPSGVGLGRRAGTVASARTKLGRPEERQAERAGAADASTLPPSSRRKVKPRSTTLNRVSVSPSSSCGKPAKESTTRFIYILEGGCWARNVVHPL